MVSGLLLLHQFWTKDEKNWVCALVTQTILILSNCFEIGYDFQFSSHIITNNCALKLAGTSNAPHRYHEQLLLRYVANVTIYNSDRAQ